jgi:exodeoxyribonuclease V alpha subunit
VASWRQLPKAAELKAQLKSIALEHFAPCFKNRRDELHESQTFRENSDSCNSSLRNAESAETILRRLEKFRILCAVRQGVYGVGAVNRLVEEILRETGLIQTDADWYAGRPVMITRNDYNLKLFNGDIGVALPDANGTLRVFFRGDGETIRPFSPLRLPEHETVYAMTVHKSQGSEFENVLLILPDRESPVLTRELIYTALTRASGSVQLWLREEIFRAAIARRVERTSGLRDALWKT